MPQATISVILRILALVLSLLPKAVRALCTLIDFVDDGCINNSVQRPEWLDDVFSLIGRLQSIGSELTTIQSKVQNYEQK